MLGRGLNILIGSQWGSEGKGKVAAWLGDQGIVDVAVCDFGPNAGHTAAFPGEKYVTHQLPISGAVGASRRQGFPELIVILPTAAINVEILLREIEEFRCASRVLIDARAVIITDRQRDLEQRPSSAARIASTQQGVGAARADRVARNENVVLARDIDELQPFVIPDATHTVREMCSRGARVLFETAQGFDLSLNHGRYPHVTSQDITVAAALNSCGVPISDLREVIAVARTFPIRVGDLEMGGKIFSSGPVYSDQEELSWDEVSSLAGKPVLEKTTTTGRVRKVFSWSHRQWKRFQQVNQPTQTVLNFTDYVSDVPGFVKHAGLPINGLWVSGDENPRSIGRFDD